MLKFPIVQDKKICILIVGMHRSGTSALTRVVNLLGADIAKDLMPPVVGANDRGYWESNTVVGIHDRLLNAIGSSFDDPFPLPDGWCETRAAMQAKSDLEVEIKRDFSESKVFVVKDPRISRLLPLWLTLLDETEIEPVVVVPVRNPLEVARSFNKREGVPLAQALLLYVRSYLDVEFASRDRRRIFVRFDQMLNDWQVLVGKLNDLVGPVLAPKAEYVDAINDFITLDLYRNKSSRAELASTAIALIVVETFEVITEAANGRSEVELRPVFDQLRGRVDEATRLFQGIFIAERERRRVEVDDLKGRYDAAVVQREGELISTRNRLTELEQLLAERVAVAATLERQLGTAQHRSHDLEHQLGACLSELASMRQRVNELEEVLSARLAELVSAQNREVDREQLLNVRSAELITSNIRAKELERAMEAKSTELIFLRSRTEEQIRALQARTAAVDERLVDIAFPRDRTAELERQLAIVSSQAGALEIRLADQTKEMNPTRDRQPLGSRRWSAGAFRSFERHVRRCFNLLRWTTNFQLLAHLRLRRQRKLDVHLINSSLFFDREWYRQTYRDVRNAGVDPVLHYLEYGANEGRNPSPRFNSVQYLSRYADVRLSGINPLVHYLKHGIEERRDTGMTITQQNSNFFIG